MKIDRNRIMGIILILISIISLYGVHLVFRPFYQAMLWALIIGVTFWPVYSRVRGLAGNRSSVSSLIVVTGIILFFLVPAILVIRSLVHQIAYAYEALQPLMPEIIEKAGHYIPFKNVAIQESITESLKESRKAIVGYLSSATGDILSILFQLAVTVLLLFFIFRDGEGLLEKIKKASLIPDRDIDIFIKETGEVIRAVIYGVIITAMIQGLLGGIGFWIAGLPAPVLFGALMFILAIVPFGGTPLIWLPAALWLIYSGMTGKGIFLIAWGVLVISMIDNFLRPYFISKRLGFHVILTFIGIVGGMMAFGFIGIFLGPFLLAISLRLFEMYLRVEA